jgi:hypothetical protein
MGLRRVVLGVALLSLVASCIGSVVAKTRDPRATYEAAVSNYTLLVATFFGIAMVAAVVGGLAGILGERGWQRVEGLILVALGREAPDPRRDAVREELGRFVSEGRLLMVKARAAAEPVNGTWPEDNVAAQEWYARLATYVKLNIRSPAVTGKLLREMAGKTADEMRFLSVMKAQVDALEQYAETLPPRDVHAEPLTPEGLARIEDGLDIRDFHAKGTWRLPDDPAG